MSAPFLEESIEAVIDGNNDEFDLLRLHCLSQEEGLEGPAKKLEAKIGDNWLDTKDVA